MVNSISEEQNEFRNGRFYPFIKNHLIEKYIEYKIPTHMAFISFEKDTSRE